MMERNQKFHLTVIDGNVYQIKTQKTKSVKTNWNLTNNDLSILMEPKKRKAKTS
jgi:hypothetical protein